jgi:hypothetical protein
MSSPLTANDLEANPAGQSSAEEQQQSTSTNDAATAAAGVVYPDPNNPYKCISNGQVYYI